MDLEILAEGPVDSVLQPLAPPTKWHSYCIRPVCGEDLQQRNLPSSPRVP